MNVHITTFATEDFERSSWLCVDSAKKHGATSHSRYNPGNILHDVNLKPYWSQLDHMFNFERGCGYWSWKPAVILSSMQIPSFKDGDIIIYADSGVEFIDNTHYIIDRMDQDIFLFGNNWEHAHWCKADIVAEIMPEWFRLGKPFKRVDGSIFKSISPWNLFGKQVQASVIFFRVSDYTRKFVKEWLDWCLFEGGRLIDDSPSRAPNHPEFRENRHDQAILTTMAYRDGLRLHWWPAEYNDGAFVYEKIPEFQADDHPVLFHHHRKRSSDWK